MKRGASVLAILLAALVVSTGVLAEDVTGEYRVGPRDLLEIKVIEIPELNVERRVSDGGTISLPMVGDFPVSGLTAAEVRSSLETLLKSKYVNRADVSVVIKEFANKPISILGAVQRPGALNMSGRWFLLQAISAAGGLTEAAGRKIYILRKNENGPSDTLEVSNRRSASRRVGDLEHTDLTRGRRQHPGTEHGPDLLHRRGQDTGSGRALLGRPDHAPVRPRKGGRPDGQGLEDDSRQAPDASGKDVETVYDYKRILAGKDPDPVLNGNDVVVVKESFF